MNSNPFESVFLLIHGVLDTGAEFIIYFYLTKLFSRFKSLCFSRIEHYLEIGETIGNLQRNTRVGIKKIRVRTT